METPPFLTAQFIVGCTVIFTAVHVILGAITFLIYGERKIAAYTSDRIGPNRTGFNFNIPILAPLKGMLGLGQSIADGLKFILKEDYSARRVDIVMFTLAPALVITPALMGFAVIPWGGVWDMPAFTIPVLNWEIDAARVVVAGAPVNAGIIYIVAIASLGIYGIVLGGWASNNKYSLLGSLRASAQMISYEIPLGLSLLTVLLMVGSLLPTDIINHQRTHGWLIISQPIAAIIFFIAALAESNRTPFDNAESETDLVGGYHTEYSSMRFALFFLAEYAHVITASAFFALLFLGGWAVFPFVNVLPDVAPGWAGAAIVLAKCGIYTGKVATMIVLIMFIRWTLPRLRYDQVMQIAWQAIIPISLGIVVLTSVMIFVGLDGWLLPSWAVMLAANVAFFAVMLLVQPLLPKSNANKRLAMIGSRFAPTAGESVVTAVTDPIAREDRPAEGTEIAGIH